MDSTKKIEPMECGIDGMYEQVEHMQSNALYIVVSILHVPQRFALEGGTGVPF